MAGVELGGGAGVQHEAAAVGRADHGWFVLMVVCRAIRGRRDLIYCHKHRSAPNEKAINCR
jgi:hypothetical protein